MKLAFLYAGQGSQKVGMGLDLFESNKIFKESFINLSPQLQDLAFNGPMETLSQTENTQPCMVAFAVAVTQVLYNNNITPAMAAGLSLGEYSALAAAGVFTNKQAIDLVRFRGESMAASSKGIDTKMIAVLQLSREKLLECCKKASSSGVVCITNYNCPGQLVIGGEANAVEAAAILAMEAGARRCIPLTVSGPFHTPLMNKAGDALKGKFKDTFFGQMKFPVIFNSTAKPLMENETIAQLLERQVKTSIYFEDSVRYMIENGIDTIIEIGPGKVLSGFVKKIDSNIKMYSIEDSATLHETLSAIKGAI